MIYWSRNDKEKAAAGNEKKRFDHLLSVAMKLPVKALPDGLVGAKLQNATSDFFELELSKNHSSVKWLP